MKTMRVKSKWWHLMLVALGVLFFMGGELTMADGPIAHWAMNDLENGVMKDITGNGHDAAYNTEVDGAMPEFKPGRVGQAMRFEKDKLMWLSVSKSENFNLKNNFTLMAWVKPSEKMARHSGEIFCKGFDINEKGHEPWHGWRLRCGWGMLFFRYTTEQGLNSQWRSPSGFAVLGSWTHVTVTFDGETVKYYMNAVEKLSKLGAGDLTTNNLPLLIGNYVGSKSVYAFDGLLDEVKIFDRVLNSDEIWDEACPE